VTADDTRRQLAALQARFSSVLRTPLVVRHGTLQADPTSYLEQARADIKPTAERTGGERLTAYHRQYWMRLFSVLHAQYPLTMRLLGAWSFNQHATRFLLAHPPRHHDIGEIGDGFADFLASDTLAEPGPHTPGAPSLPHEALLEAARLDAAFRQVCAAPEEPAFSVRPEDSPTLPSRRLRFSRAFARVSQRWPLLQLRAELVEVPGEGAVALPAKLVAPQTWSIVRTPRGLVQEPLDPEHARLLALLEAHRIGDALRLLEAESPEAERHTLPMRVQRHLARSMARGVFAGWRTD